MDNNFSVPVSVELKLELDNLKGENITTVIATIPAKSTGFELRKFKKNDANKPFQCNYRWRITLGDVSRKTDEQFEYALPFIKGSKYLISQGPGGHYSHQEMFAYDFSMPEGTPITASREGVVAMVKSDSEKGGPNRSYINDANYISVYHEDGTIANYIHLKKDGVVVKEGQFVKKGELIGYSGNTGFSNGPHLHFEVVKSSLETDKNRSVAFKWEAVEKNYLSLKRGPSRYFK